MQRGKVILAGAGPGDPDLITVKAAQYLSMADVVICDRLVNETLLNLYVAPGTTIIFTGKEGYSKDSTPQSQINTLLLEHYQEDKILVRLKGGDTAFFSNILDELLTLTSNNIPYEIVPGISAASGASAYCGFPLTARGYADSVRFITSSNKTTESNHYWQELAQTNDTLVCYMSGAKLQSIVENLKAYGMDIDKEIAVIEQATTPRQRTTIYKTTDESLAAYNFQSPTLIIIGRVVQLYHSFKWIENSELTESYFKPAAPSIQLQPLSIFYKRQSHANRKETKIVERTTRNIHQSGIDLDERVPFRIALP